MTNRHAYRLAVAFSLLPFLAGVGMATEQPQSGKTLRVGPKTSSEAIENATQGLIGSKWALLVGIDEYAHPQSGGYFIEPLLATVHDVNALHAVLADPMRGGFPPEQVSVLTNKAATKREILTSLHSIARRASPDDLVLFYFSGHGWRDDARDTAYLLPHDAEMEDPSTTCIDLADLDEKFQEIQARKLVTILDACHSGGIKRPGAMGVTQTPYSKYLTAFSKAEGRPMLLSSDETEVSWEMPDKQSSVFTHFLIKGMNGEADRDGNGIVGFMEVALYVEEAVPAYTRSFESVQRPTRRDAGGAMRGDIPLAVDMDVLLDIEERLRAYREGLSELDRLAQLGVLSREHVDRINEYASAVTERKIRKRHVESVDEEMTQAIDGLIDRTSTLAAYQEVEGRLYPNGLPSTADLSTFGTGFFLVNTVPIGAAIYIDDKFVGYTPRTVEGVATGRRVVRLVHEQQGHSHEQTVTIRYGQATKLRHAW